MSERRRTVAIVTDSTASLTPAKANELGVHVVPIYTFFGTEAYRDGVDLDAEGFYRLLRSSKRLPTTSQPPIDDFVRAYTSLAKDADAIVSIHMSRKMSATFETAQAASRYVTGVPIHVLDSNSITAGLGLMVVAAARAAAAGQDADAVVRRVVELIPKMKIIFTVETLEYLRRGGRIGGAAALAGYALSIKPVLCLRDGRIESLEKPRTKRRAIERVLDLVAENVGTSKAVGAAVFHCAAPEEGKYLAEQISTRFECSGLLTLEAGPIIGAHAGPGTLGVAFYAD